ncbi:alpha/beta hydrolase [Rugosimonospora acidiphila]|uniref:Alpha/beta hydrolase n=1 Tax=Rugosimonospora acidiphila TaxID=556531 RepID=A0ABP9S725_9ACTN
MDQSQPKVPDRSEQVDQIPTVLIPGLLCSPLLYAEQLPDLWRLGPVTLANHCHAGDLTELARSILAGSPPRFTLVGLSMGGYLAFEIMRQAAHRVDRLALLDTTARADSPERRARRHDQLRRVGTGQFHAVVDELYDGWVHPARVADAQLRQLVRQMADETGPDAFGRQQAAIMNRPDSRDGLAAIDCPTLVLVGAQDTVTPVEQARELADAIPDARLAVIPDCGHLSTLERPAAATRALIDWLTP